MPFTGNSLVTCHTSLHPTLSISRSVTLLFSHVHMTLRPALSVRRLVGPSVTL